MLRTAIMISLLAMALPASAKLYKCQDADGSVSYTDTPCTNGEELKLPPIPTYTPRNLPRAKAREPQSEDKGAYTQLEVSKPKQDELIIDNTGKLVIAINVTPDLDAKQGHQFAIVLDGTRLKTSGTTTRVRVDNVDPGSHTVQALIIAKDGNTVKQSPIISFYMKRQSVLEPVAPQEYKRDEKGNIVIDPESNMPVIEPDYVRDDEGNIVTDPDTGEPIIKGQATQHPQKPQGGLPAPKAPGILPRVPPTP